MQLLRGARVSSVSNSIGIRGRLTLLEVAGLVNGMVRSYAILVQLKVSRPWYALQLVFPRMSANQNLQPGQFYGEILRKRRARD